MFEFSTWTDPAVLAAVGTFSAAVGAGSNRLLIWWSDRSKQQIDSSRQRSDSNDGIRDDLIQLVKFQGEEIVQLRQELAAARRELREFSDLHQRTVAEWQERYGTIYSELIELRVIVKQANHST